MPTRKAGERRRPTPRRPAKPAPRAKAKTTRQAGARAAKAQRDAVVIAGVGASAGGLEAFSQLLQAMPAAPGLAIVLVQHLAPLHESALPALLSARTHLQVVQAA